MKTFSFKPFLLTLLLVILSNNAFCQTNSNGDDRMKIRLGFTSSNNIHRQILVTVDSNATSGIDFGYDAENFENHLDDMYWMIEDRKFLIQGTDSIDETTTLSLGLHIGTNGSSIISIEELINVPEDLEIRILDKETNSSYNIKETTNLTIDLNAGEYLSRFELIFTNNNNTDSNNNNNDHQSDNDEEIIEEIIESVTDIDNEVVTEEAKMELNYINKIKSISIKNIGSKNIKSVKVFSISGQLITEFNNIKAIDQALIKTYGLDAGNYILILTSDSGRVSKKVSVK